jgi:hypothetical protein
MTVASQTASITIAGDGSNTSFAYDFEIPYQPGGTVPAVLAFTTTSGINTVLVLGVDFSITGVGDPAGGVVTYPLTGSPLPLLSSITINRALEYTQESAFPAQSLYPPDIEAAIDALEFQIQQLNDRLIALETQ